MNGQKEHVQSRRCIWRVNVHQVFKDGQVNQHVKEHVQSSLFGLGYCINKECLDQVIAGTKSV